MSRPLWWKTCRRLCFGPHSSGTQGGRLKIIITREIKTNTRQWLLGTWASTKGSLCVSVTGPAKATCGSRLAKSYGTRIACSHVMDNNSNLDDVFNGETEEDLRGWLQDRGINTSLFGTVNGSKTLQCLLHEIAEGESLLRTAHDGTPLRMVSIISVNIKNKEGQSLYETRQRLPGGGVRERNLLLSEKLLPDESWKAASKRGIQEELGSILPENPEIHVLDDTYSKSTEKSTSSSYPGLCTEYVCHKVEARVSGLPDTDFVTEEKRPDGVLLSSWAWRHASPL